MCFLSNSIQESDSPLNKLVELKLTIRTNLFFIVVDAAEFCIKTNFGILVEIFFSIKNNPFLFVEIHTLPSSSNSASVGFCEVILGIAIESK